MAKVLAYPAWVCHDCAMKAGGKPWGSSTFHMGTCDVCLKARTVTQPRDYCYPAFKPAKGPVRKKRSPKRKK